MLYRVMDINMQQELFPRLTWSQVFNPVHTVDVNHVSHLHGFSVLIT